MSLRLTISLLMISLTLTGCSVSRALNKPAPKDLSFLTRGTSRDAVRSELGDFTLSADSAQCDVHAYPEGSGGGKYARAFLYSILDLGSAGIFEIFLNPIEAAIGNDKIRTKTCFNEQNLLVRASEFGRGGRETRLKLIPADDPVLEASLDAPRPPVVVTPPATPQPVPTPAAEPLVPQSAETAPVVAVVAAEAAVQPTTAAPATQALPVAVATPEQNAGNVVTPALAATLAPVAESQAADAVVPAASVVTEPAADSASAAVAAAAAPAVLPPAASEAQAATAEAKPAPVKLRKKGSRKH